MFSYPSCPWIPIYDNLVSGCTGSPTMPQSAGSGMETAMTTEYLAMRLDRLIELLQDWLGVTSPVVAATSWPRATTPTTSRASIVTVPSYLRSVIAVPHGSQRAATLTVKVAVRALMAYSS
jgi:hypothetical protein